MIVLTAFGDPEEALRAMKAGADDFVSKPYDPDRLRMLVKRILERRELIDELERLRKQMRGDYPFHNMVSKSPKIRKIFDLIEQVGPLGSTVLDPRRDGHRQGAGRAGPAHGRHARRSGPFVALNCAVLNESLLESELFGHEKGSFTGAEKRKIGRFELANGGTLLLDEIGDLAPSLQAKLLRVLQTGSFERVGGTESLKVDVRIVAATHRRLEDEVKRGRFRADLFYRLNVIRIELPPLRERTEDIPLLATHFLQKHGSSDRSSPITEIASDAMQALLRHNWPGQRARAGKRDQGGAGAGRRNRPSPRRPAGIGRTANPGGPATGLAARRRAPASRPDRRLDRPGRTRVLRARALALQGQRRPDRPPQRPLAAERHAEAAEVRARAGVIQVHAQAETRRPGARAVERRP